MLRGTLILLSLLLCSLTAGGAWGAETVRPLYTNKARFRIPYRFDAAELARAGAVEIHLYVSKDLGKNWSQAEKVGLQQGKFEFTAPKEGEYWFAVRTADARGNLNPPGQIIDPGLIVIVDATPPAFKLDLASTQPNRVEIAWGVTDANLDMESLIVEYREDQSQEWKRVHLIPSANGKTSWTTTAAKTEVRGKILDRAENATSMIRELDIMQKSAAPLTIPAPLRNHTPAAAEGNQGEQPYVPDFSQPIAQEPVPELSGKEPPFKPDDMNLSLTDPAQHVPESMPVEKPAGPIGDKYSKIDYPDVLPGINSSQDLEEEVFGNYDQFSHNNNRTAQKQKVRVVNTNQFQVDYQIDDVGPSGVSSVDIYITENDGQRWWKYGQDRDLQSPAMIEVPHDGQYGFAIRVKNGIGSSAPPPQVGERPELMVKIDRTPPAIRTMKVHQGEGVKLNRLQFEWKVDDENLAEKSVSLYAASSTEGPWEPVMGWQADKGGYEWVMGKEIPPQLYFRLAVRDSAGNVATSTTPTPIAMDLSRPTARILDVAPLR